MTLLFLETNIQVSEKNVIAYTPSKIVNFANFGDFQTTLGYK